MNKERFRSEYSELPINKNKMKTRIVFFIVVELIITTMLYVAGSISCHTWDIMNWTSTTNWTVPTWWCIITCVALLISIFTSENELPNYKS